jgi:hypothetical protein
MGVSLLLSSYQDLSHCLEKTDLIWIMVSSCLSFLGEYDIIANVALPEVRFPSHATSLLSLLIIVIIRVI